jgi:uncharacterized phiE125 gp8 family phage protein
MISYLLAGPAEEPVTLAEAKAWVKVDGADEDALLATLITAARLHLESVTGRALLTQSWRLVLDAWPAGGEVRLPVAPLSALTAIRAFDEDGDEHTIGLAQFLVEPGGTPVRLVLPATVAGMPVLRQRFGIEIDYVAGFGEAADVPQELKQALLVLVAHWFEHRDAVVIAGSGAVIPFGFDRLIAPWREVRL